MGVKPEGLGRCLLALWIVLAAADLGFGKEGCAIRKNRNSASAMEGGLHLATPKILDLLSWDEHLGFRI